MLNKSLARLQAQKVLTFLANDQIGDALDRLYTLVELVPGDKEASYVSTALALVQGKFKSADDLLNYLRLAGVYRNEVRHKVDLDVLRVTDRYLREFLDSFDPAVVAAAYDVLRNRQEAIISYARETPGKLSVILFVARRLLLSRFIVPLDATVDDPLSVSTRWAKDDGYVILAALLGENYPIAASIIPDLSELKCDKVSPQVRGLIVMYLERAVQKLLDYLNDKIFEEDLPGEAAINRLEKLYSILDSQAAILSRLKKALAMPEDNEEIE